MTRIIVKRCIIRHMETPLISVIVPVYNVLPYLEDCLDSLLRQNYPKLEFIVVDDGATDGSGVFCDDFAKKDPRMKVIHQENGGLSAARNRGIAEATGNYITFLDADDQLAPDCVKYLYSLVVKYKSKMSICAIREQTEKGKEVDYGRDYSECNMSTEEALGRMLREEGFNVSAYAKLYRRDLWDGVKFPDGAIHEDLATTYKLLSKCPNIPYGNEAKYIYKKRSDSISSAGFSTDKLNIITFTDEMCDDLEKNFPYLATTLDLRRMHARFSVLWMMLSAKNLTPEEEKVEQEIIKSLKENKKSITKNHHATLRDKIAIWTLLIHKNCFKLAWQIYKLFR